MQTFPKIEPSQVAIVISESTTGHILDGNLSLLLNDKQKMYTVYESIEEAIAVSKLLMTRNKNIECTIFNSTRELLYFFHTVEDFDGGI